ncbi:MAG: sialate O-acetylesterase [Gemmatales bacterium]
MIRGLFALAVLLLLWSVSYADVKLHSLFTSHMVLQQKTTVPVWGQAAPGEQVTVKFQGQTQTATADDKGKWSVKLSSLQPGGPFEMTVEGKNTIKLEDVLVGEVWLCSGQSNMEWPVRQSKDPKEVIEKAANNQLRLFQVKKLTSNQPLSEPALDPAWKQWRVASPESVPGFSAVGYFFGLSLQKARNVPVGMIHTSWGGTPAEAWTSEEFLQKTPELAYYVENVKKQIANFPEAMKKYDEQMKKYDEEAIKLRAENKTVPVSPRKPNHPDQSPGTSARLYNAMINPLVPYAVKGAIWYQGESNAGRAYEYRTLFPTMIQSWRAAWGYEFPFLFVQLAPFKNIVEQPKESDWAELREAQLLISLKLANTAQAVITDTTDEKTDQKDIHPKNKAPVGERLALAARQKVYGEPIVGTGPLFERLTITGDKAVLSFTSVGGGLVCKGDKLTGFTIAGADKKFYNAEAKIDGDKVVVTCEAVKEPVAVRFGWTDYPVVNFFNKEGIPASPFRTDEWPGVTWPRKKTE